MTAKGCLEQSPCAVALELPLRRGSAAASGAGRKSAFVWPIRKTRKGSRWLRQALVEVAHVASKTKGTYLAAQYRRLAARRGKKRAFVALGHTVLVIAYHILTRRQPYRDLGATYFDKLERHRVEHRLVRRLERMGYQVVLQPNAAMG